MAQIPACYFELSGEYYRKTYVVFFDPCYSKLLSQGWNKEEF